MSNQTPETKINLRGAAQHAIMGTVLLLAAFGLRLFTTFGLPVVTSTRDGPAMQNPATVVRLMLFADTIMAIGFLGISCIVIRPGIEESRIHPLERSKANWAVLADIRKRVEFLARTALAFLFAALAFLFVQRQGGGDISALTAGTLLIELGFSAALAWLTWGIYTRAKSIIST